MGNKNKVGCILFEKKLMSPRNEHGKDGKIGVQYDSSALISTDTPST